jgi:hypothetical protein
VGCNVSKKEVQKMKHAKKKKKKKKTRKVHSTEHMSCLTTNSKNLKGSRKHG